MTELEKIAYAKSFIDKLANGINPVDGKPVPDGDIVNNVRLSRCFFYVSDILRQVYENGGVTKPKRISKIPFSVTPEQRNKFEYSSTPISVSEIAKRIFAMADNENMEKVSYFQITQWLLDIGLLYLHDTGEKRSARRPTEEGLKMGIIVETRMGSRGEYQAVLYSEDVQHFIIDNLDAVIAIKAKKDNR